MLFLAVLIDFSNSKVCLIGEWSIVHGTGIASMRKKAIIEFNVVRTVDSAQKL